MPQITVTKRTSLGSAESRRMRRSGYVPAVIYGRGGKEDLLAVRETEYMKTIGFKPTGIVSLQGLGKPVSVLIKEVQWDPLTDKPLHIDFYRVALDQIVSVKVGLHARGTPKGALFGGVTEQILHDLPIKVKASDIPQYIEIDISDLGIGDAIHVSDLVLPEGVVADISSEQPVIHVVAPTIEKVAAVEEEEEAGEEGAEEAEGEEETTEEKE
jgi:large subunit ribosomal protein L25